MQGLHLDTIAPRNTCRKYVVHCGCTLHKAILRLMGLLSYSLLQALLGDTNFMTQLQQYDKDNIPPAYIIAVRPYLAMPELAPDTVKKASKAAYGLCCWVRAMEAYDR